MCPERDKSMSVFYPESVKVSGCVQETNTFHRLNLPMCPLSICLWADWVRPCVPHPSVCHILRHPYRWAWGAVRPDGDINRLHPLTFPSRWTVDGFCLSNCMVLSSIPYLSTDQCGRVFCSIRPLFHFFDADGHFDGYCFWSTCFNISYPSKYSAWMDNWMYTL